jgi:tyrosyl-tRNA synthetase
VPQYEGPAEEVESGIGFVELCVEKCPVFPSKGELRKLIQGGGVSLNKEKVESPDRNVSTGDLIAGKYLLVQKGKKNYYLITVK